MFSIICAIVLYLTILQVKAQTCSLTTDCAQGCCSTSGFCGFGPEFCGTGNCTSTCDAVAQCGQFAPAGQTACPLNVCCSQFGFCGTTSDFCGTGCQNGCAAVHEPSSSGSSSSQRTIGYYESWNVQRPCDVWEPENINPKLWTHINYAFALIDGSFNLGQMNSFDVDFYSRVVSLKQLNPSLQVFISVGGWSAGGAIFSSMASTAANRAKFIASALALMNTYGFDGIDIDWEYPAAGDRGGVPEDTANFVQLLSELRAVCGTKYAITATIPSSYWYMQGFDIVGMEPYLDWFNFMSYDIHGTWDGDNPNTQAVVQPHTNLTEISLGLDLLWRNNINPSKVVLGLGFYGRSFTLKDPSCNTPFCPFSGGGNPGDCTQTSGILSNAEIQRLITANDITPILESVAGVKYMSWDSNQWVSYDDEDTYTLKRNFANGLGLGGTMAWALDLDDPSTLSSQNNLNLGIMRAVDGDQVDANPTYALSKLAANQASDQASAVTYWTSCNPNPICAPGFYTPADGLGHGKIFDIDLGHISADGCHGGSKGYNRALCVENGVSFNNCGWYGKPKKCGNTCPKGYELISMNTHPSNSKTGCQTGAFASYCCESVTTNFNNLGYCPVSTFTNLLSNGLGSRLNSVDSLPNLAPRAIDFGDSGDDFFRTTAEECAYALNNQASGGSGFLGSGKVFQVPNDGVPNFLPGIWTPMGNGKWQLLPSFQINYPNKQSGKLQCTSSTTITATSRTWTTTETKICNGKSYPQACQHYRSVESVYGASILSCAYPLVSGDIPRPEVNTWNGEHKSEWISWIPTWGTITKGAYKGINSYCDRDEYPPALFLQGTGGANAPLINTAAYIRYLPQAENAGAGQIWSGFCASKPKSKEGDVEGGQVIGQICHYTQTNTYSLKAFSMSFKSMPNDPDDGITTNMCWPKILAVNPGFALLSSDSWYSKNAFSRTWIPSYRVASVPAILTAGVVGPPRARVPGKPLKRSEQFIFPSNVEPTPENIFVDNGNSSRRPTDEELLENFGLLKCESANCEAEAKELGLELIEEYVPAPEVITVSGPNPTPVYVDSSPVNAPSVSGPSRTPSVSERNGYRPAESSSGHSMKPPVGRHQRSKYT